MSTLWQCYEIVTLHSALQLLFTVASTSLQVIFWYYLETTIMGITITEICKYCYITYFLRWATQFRAISFQKVCVPFLLFMPPSISFTMFCSHSTHYFKVNYNTNHLAIIIIPSGTKYSRMDQVNIVEDSLWKFEGV